MKYFISRSIYTFNSGVEHSQANRTLMYKKHKEQAKYVTRDYNRFWVRDAERVGLDAESILNMYDYFQGTVDVERTTLSIREFPQLALDQYQLVEHGPNYSTLDHAGRQIARINIMPETVGLVGDVEYYDRTDAVISRDNYDWRGFKSSTEYFHPDGSLGARRYYNLEGEVVLENVCMNVDNQLQSTMWKLLNYKGHDYRFDTEDQLFLFFLNEVMQKSSANVLVSDYRDLDYVIADVENTDSKWIAFHGAHADKNGDPFAAYAIALDLRAKDFDGIIVPTKEQKKEITKAFPKLKVLVASDISIAEKTLKAKPVWLRDRSEGRVIFSGRMEVDKRPMEAIQAFVKIAAKVPMATLELRGYTNDPNYLNDMKNFVNQQGLQDRVIFGEYLTTTELNDFYDMAQIIVNTSTNEARGMHLIEAMAHGVPVITYDTKYGLSDLVKNDTNGYIVPNGDQAQMARRIQQMLTDKVLWAKLSKGAYEKAEKFGSNKVYQQWKKILG